MTPKKTARRDDHVDSSIAQFHSQDDLSVDRGQGVWKPGLLGPVSLCDQPSNRTNVCSLASGIEAVSR